MINVSDSVHMGLLFDIRNKTANLCKCVFQKNPSEIAALNPFWSELFIWSKSNYLNPSMSAMTSSTHEGASATWWCTWKTWQSRSPNDHIIQSPSQLPDLSTKKTRKVKCIISSANGSFLLLPRKLLFIYTIVTLLDSNISFTHFN